MTCSLQLHAVVHMPHHTTTTNRKKVLSAQTMPLYQLEHFLLPSPTIRIGTDFAANVCTRVASGSSPAPLTSSACLKIHLPFSPPATPYLDAPSFTAQCLCNDQVAGYPLRLEDFQRSLGALRLSGHPDSRLLIDLTGTRTHLFRKGFLWILPGSRNRVIIRRFLVLTCFSSTTT